MSEKSDGYITPSLPEGLKIQAKAWENIHRMPVFINVIKQVTVDLPENYCHNCAGMGFVLASFANFGPTGSPVNKGDVIKWFDGNKKHGQGWYSIEKTEAFPCHRCQGQRAEVDLSTGEMKYV